MKALLAVVFFFPLPQNVVMQDLIPTPAGMIIWKGMKAET